MCLTVVNINPVAYLGIVILFGTKPIIVNDNDYDYYYWCLVAFNTRETIYKLFIIYLVPVPLALLTSATS